jgi:hypothetical protein
MPRVKLLSAMAYDLHTYEQEGVGDPVIRVLGELPSPSQPFAVNRVYRGAQGVYEENLLLLDPDEVVIWERGPVRIELRGEMFEDLFRSQIGEDIEIRTPDEHKLVFLIDGAESGRIPVFIDARESLTAAGVLGDAAEVALKKGSILWLGIPQRDGSVASRPAWYVQQGPKVFVLKGPDEQELPNLEQCDVVDMYIKAKDVKATIGVMRAAVRVVENSSEEFEKIATIGMGTRLNLQDGNAALDRWKSTCTMVELTPQT